MARVSTARPRRSRTTTAAARRCGLVLIAAAASLLGTTVLPRVAVAADRPDTRGRIALFAQDWNGYASGRSSRAWRRAAHRHLLLVGPSGPTYGERLSKLRRWNPRLKLLVYDPGPYTVAGTDLYDRLLSHHPRYFARDLDGNLLTVQAAGGAPAYPNNTLMDPGVRGWRIEIARRVRAAIVRYGFDGVYLDSMGLGVFTGNTTGVPVDRSTGKRYTQAAWMRAEAKMVNRIRRSIGGRRFVFASGLVNGYVYDRYAHILAGSRLDGMMTDSWMRTSASSVDAYPSVELFRKNLWMAKNLQARGRYFFGWTKVWTRAGDAQRHAWDRFALASYLLIKARRALYAFTPAFDVDRTFVYDRMQLARLGRALGDYTVRDGVFRRRFVHGSVRVDPAAHTARIRVTS
jgi:hypothetical protein